MEKEYEIVSAHELTERLHDKEKGKNGIRLDYLKISGGSITGIKIDGLVNCVFENVVFDTLDTNDGVLKENIFISCHFQNIKGEFDFDGAAFKNCIFFRCLLQRASFIRCRFINTGFSACSLECANFSLSEYEKLKVENCNVNKTLLEQNKERMEKEQTNLKKLKVGVLKHVQGIIETLLHDEDEYLAGAVTCIQNMCQKLEEELSITKLNHIDFEDLAHQLNVYDKKINNPILDENIEQMQLREYDFSNFDFEEKNLSEIQFVGSDFTHANLAGCICTKCDFTNCRFDHAILIKTKFQQCKFKGATFEGTIMDKNNRKLFMQEKLIEQENDIEDIVTDFDDMDILGGENKEYA